jgi:hypothetical protein
MRNFETWETQDLEELFGLERVKQMHLLDDWLAATTTLDSYTQKRVETLKEKIFEFVEFWNEDELKLQCISKIVDFADYDNIKPFNMFSQRSISATINNIEIGGRVDFVLAKGRQKPMKPYFFIHEYKQSPPAPQRGRKEVGDPKGQLLSEMLVAQVRNEGKIPVYGCYVLGRSWFFVILNGKNYAVSRAYDASQPDIYTVIAILRKVKEYIQNLPTN